MPRPREFDPEKALEAAMRLFWEKGYEGASYADLCAATGVARPGLYAAFGDKEALFRKALDLYERRETASLREALDQPTAREVVTALLRRSARATTQPGKPSGCLGVNGALACSDGAASIQAELSRRRAASQRLLESRLERARAEGDLPRFVDPGDLARLVAVLMQGIAVQAKAGATRRQLDAALDLALRMIP